MNAFLLDSVLALFRSWTRLYTVGLPADFRDTRRAEIESDLWEQLRDDNIAEYPSVRTATLILFRWLLGISEDVIWRAERWTEIRFGKTPITGVVDKKNISWIARLLRWGFFGLIVFVVFSSIAGVISAWGPRPLTMNEADTGSAVALLLLTGVACIAGLLSERHSPMFGAVLISLGAMLFGIVWSWTIVGPILAAALLLVALNRAYRLQRGKA